MGAVQSVVDSTRELIFGKHMQNAFNDVVVIDSFSESERDWWNEIGMSNDPVTGLKKKFYCELLWSMEIYAHKNHYRIPIPADNIVETVLWKKWPTWYPQLNLKFTDKEYIQYKKDRQKYLKNNKIIIFDGTIDQSRGGTDIDDEGNNVFRAQTENFNIINNEDIVISLIEEEKRVIPLKF
jgi:hypothetical protein